MQKIISLLILTSFLILPAQASELAPQGTRERKFQRGLLNIFFSPVEISAALEPEKTKDTLIPSWFFGFSRGAINAVIRAMTGIYEVVTTPIPSPPHYQPIYHPEFALEHLGFLKDESQGVAASQ